MPERSKAVATDSPHRVTQRKNYRQRISKDKDDFRQHLGWLGDCTRRYFEWHCPYWISSWL